MAPVETLSYVAHHRLERARYVIKSYPAWAKEARPTLSGWMGSTCFTPSTAKQPRVIAYGNQVHLPSTGETFENMHVMELRSGYLQQVYAGGNSSMPKWSYKDVDAFAIFSPPGLSMPNARRRGSPPEGLVCLDASTDYWQYLQLIGTRCELDPATGRWWGSGEWPATEDMRDTKLYITIVSHAMNHRMVKARLVQGELREQRNAFFQPQYGHLMTRLHHAIAQEMVELFECWRVETDAYWVPERLAAAAIAWLWERWHIHVRVKDATWRFGGGGSSIIPQPEAVREALSAGIRDDLPPSPGSAPFSVQDRAVAAAQAAGPKLSPGTIDHVSPRRPHVNNPRTAAEREVAQRVRWRADFTSGALVPPPMPPSMVELHQRHPEAFVTPPDQPWLCEGWSLIKADIDPSWFYEDPDKARSWSPMEQSLPPDTDGPVLGGRSPPIDYLSPRALR